MVLTEVKRQVGSPDLRIQWEIRLKPMFPLKCETQKIQVKLFGLVL